MSGLLRSAWKRTAMTLRERTVVLHTEDAAQLLEFALVLPLLLAIVVGIFDFGNAYNLKQKLNNAAREGARFAAAEYSDSGSLSGTNPPSVQAVRDVVANYLTSANVSKCAIGTTPTKTALQWTYSSSSVGCGSFSLVIDRGYAFLNSSGTTVVASRVTIAYPVTWTFGRIIGLLVKGSIPPLPPSITSDAVMQNLF